MSCTIETIIETAQAFEHDTGMVPQAFAQVRVAHPIDDPVKLANALKSDLEWYRRHTDGIEKRLNHMLSNAAWQP